MEAILLASGSLRRQEYFKMLKIPFKIFVPGIDESNTNNLDAKDFAMDLAKRKLDKTLHVTQGKEPLWIFAADTLVSLDGEIFGKSGSRDAAKSVLQKLSGKTHEVWTGCALYNNRTKATDCRCAKTKVTFTEINDASLEWYLNSAEWQGAAGSYKIQGIAACFIDNIEGSYSSVVGLPIHLFYTMLLDNGYKMDIWGGGNRK
ncbi:MAG: Maf family protein [Termitinemataceae bacterium]|nr:MAG: Maf family protein [Termitinemataceae bacterium]